MIAGGAEAIIIPLTIAGFCQMKAMSTRNDEPTKASRPFDANRDGFVCGEGGDSSCWNPSSTRSRATRASTRRSSVTA